MLEFWDALTPSQQIYYWGYICFAAGVITVWTVDYISGKVKAYYGIK